MIDFALRWEIRISLFGRTINTLAIIRNKWIGQKENENILMLLLRYVFCPHLGYLTQFWLLTKDLMELERSRAGDQDIQTVECQAN